MSKYLKLIAMKGGGKVNVQKASIGRLIGLGARKGVEMLTVSKSAIQKGAKDKLARDKFQESLKDFQRGKPEGLENMKVFDKLPSSKDLFKDEQVSGAFKSMNKIIGSVPASAGLSRSASVIDKFKNLFKKD
jgi:hypothetical protein